MSRSLIFLLNLTGSLATSRHGSSEKRIMASKIYTTNDQLLGSYLCNLLESAGYSVLTQNTRVESPQMDGALLDWHSELWLIRDSELLRAQQFLQQALAGEGV